MEKMVSARPWPVALLACAALVREEGSIKLAMAWHIYRQAMGQR